MSCIGGINAESKGRFFILTYIAPEKSVPGHAATHSLRLLPFLNLVLGFETDCSPASVSAVKCETVLPAEGSEGFFVKILQIGTSLVVHWLRICFLMQGTRVRSLDGELGSHMPRSN